MCYSIPFEYIIEMYENDITLAYYILENPQS